MGGDASIHMVGVPTDKAVIGRKGAAGGPTGIRDAMRFIGGHDTATGQALGATLRDHGDVAGLDSFGDDVAAMHEHVRAALRPLMARGRALVLGGDHGLTYAHIGALCDSTDGSIGLVVIDAHYDLRDHEGQPTSGTPFRRILESFPERVRPEHIVEIGIRPFANAPSLAAYAAEQGVKVYGMPEVRAQGIQEVLEGTMAALADVDHLWLSIDIDGLDQSIASGCSAPGAGGLRFEEADAIVRALAADDRLRGMDVLEVAPSLDPSGNTCRSAAQLIATFVGGTD